MSGPAWRALERTALAMGAREGTTPQHDPLMASVSARLQAGSHARGHREGLAQGHREGLVQARMDHDTAPARPGGSRGSHGGAWRRFGDALR